MCLGGLERGVENSHVSGLRANSVRASVGDGKV